MRVGEAWGTDESMHRRMGRWSEKAVSRTEVLEMEMSEVVRKRSRTYSQSYRRVLCLYVRTCPTLIQLSLWEI